MYAVKDNALILRGQRNKVYVLWDINIPYYEVYKRIIQDESYSPPTSHTALYTSHNISSINSHDTPSTFTRPSSKSPLRNPIHLLKTYQTV